MLTASNNYPNSNDQIVCRVACNIASSDTFGVGCCRLSSPNVTIKKKGIPSWFIVLSMDRT